MQDQKFFTFEEIFESIKTIESNINSLLISEPFSNRTLQLIKKLIVLCNSISITLLQQEKLEETVLLLKIADKADLELSRFGLSSSLWQGRLMTPNLLAFLYFKQKRYMDSLKFLYKSHSLSQEIKEKSFSVHNHLKNLSNLLTFMVLWKMSKYPEAEKYLSSVQEIDFESIRGKNLFGLVSLSKAGILVRKNKEYILALQISEESLKKMNEDDVIYDLLQNTIHKIYFEMSSEQKEDWLLTENFLNVFFVTCFIPLIANGTPVLVSQPKNFEILAKPLRPAFSANRPKSDKSKQLSLDNIIQEKNYRESASTTRRSNQKSIEKLNRSSLTRRSFEMASAYVSGTSRISYFSPRISQTRPKSSRVSKNFTNVFNK